MKQISTNLQSLKPNHSQMLKYFETESCVLCRYGSEIIYQQGTSVRSAAARDTGSKKDGDSADGITHQGQSLFGIHRLRSLCFLRLISWRKYSTVLFIPAIIDT